MKCNEKIFSSVQPTFSEPVSGWVDNLNGPVSVVYGIGRGVTRCLLGDKYVYFNHVFADNVVKAMIIASWENGILHDLNQVPIINIASDLIYSSKEIFKTGSEYRRNHPLRYYLWPSRPFIYKSYFWYCFFSLLTHFIPALLIDLALILTKKKPKLFAIQRKGFMTNTHLLYFMKNSWKFINNNYISLMNSILPEDKKSFTIEYFGPKAQYKQKDKYFVRYLNGMRKYIACEGPSTKDMILKQKRLLFIEKVWKIFWLIVFVYYMIFKLRIISVITDRVYTYFENINV